MATATVDLAALSSNLHELRSRTSAGCEFLAAVKANAYGHGAVELSRRLEREGVRWFGVATPEEAVGLREAGVAGRILLLGPALEGVGRLVEADIDLVVVDPHSFEILADSRTRPRVHLKVDTGMGRLGLPKEEALRLAGRIDRNERMTLESVWTHLSSADEPGSDLTERQLEEFEWLRTELEAAGIAPPLFHACNSAGLLSHPAGHYGMVRAGIALYGYPPEGTPPDVNLKPVMRLSAPVVFVKRVREGTPISYGATWRAPRETTIATIRMGYADGYPRLLSNVGWARVAGERAPVVGRVCMDQLMLDVGDADVAVGDEAVLFGPDGPTAAQLASLIGTIPYEMLTSVSPRVARVYRG